MANDSNSRSFNFKDGARLLVFDPEKILQSWEKLVLVEIPAAKVQKKSALRDMLPHFLALLGRALVAGSYMRWDQPLRSAAEEHGEQRANLYTYTIDQILSEYRLLRTAVFRSIETTSEPVGAITRDIILESIERAITDAATIFVEIQLAREQEATAGAETAVKRLRDLQIITESALVNSVSLENLLSDLVERIKTAFQADTVAILLVDEERKNLKIKAALGLKPELINAVKIPIDESISGRVVKSGLPVVVQDVSKSLDFASILSHANVTSVLSIPLKLNDLVQGVFHIGFVKEKKFGIDEITLMQLIGNRIAVAVEHAGLYEQVRTDNSKLRDEQELREQFVATLSHDLRTPLTVAKMGAQMIVRMADISDKVRDFSGRIVDGINRADKMINDLLDVKRIRVGEAIPIQITHCDFSQIISATVDELVTVHGERFKLSIPTESLGFWSADGLRRVVENLAMNAIKYGSSSDPVLISLVMTEKSAKLNVHNSGNPISENDLATLFEPYRRIVGVDQVVKKGWGLGLTLVKGIVEAHRGKVIVRSSPEAGTDFIIDLPRDSRLT